MLFWRYCKDIQTSYYGYFEHTWLHTPKMIVSTCRRLRCLSVCQKQTSSIAFSLRYYILKNAAIWLADSILAHNSRARILPDVALLMISTRILVSISDYFQEKRMTKFFKESILGPFCPNLGAEMNFPGKKDSKRSVFRYSNYLPLCQLLNHFWEKTPNWRVDRCIFGQAGRQKRLFWKVQPG